jgi:hypothetical protein
MLGSMNTSPIDESYDYAVVCLDAVGGDIAALPLPLQTLLLVESAQGIIDNGGLAYFYEADFPNNPPYADFVDAYRRIGAESAALCIEASSLMFPFEDPHFFAPLRELWLEKLRADQAQEFSRLNERICCDATVWEKLADYVDRHRHAFSAA